MHISKRFLFILLAVSLLLNVIGLLHFFGRGPSGESGTLPEEAPEKPLLESKKKAPSLKPLSLSMLHLDSIPPRVRVRRSAILNTLADKYTYQSYLEIGQGRREQNLDWIQCRVRIGVDPAPEVNAAFQMTSDEFFAVNNDRFDLIFIDGLHHANQVERDILNALDILNDNGSIVVHDCNPTTEQMQLVPPKKGKAWTGDVWKTWVRLRATRPDLTMFVVDTDFGCGVIRRGRQEPIKIAAELTYDQLDQNRVQWLNLMSVQDFLAGLRGRE